MKKFLSLTVAAVFVLALAAPAFAGDESKEVKLSGWITDEWCGAKNANASAESADCAKGCAKKGAALVLFSEGKIYKLSDQDAALKNVGHPVIVMGTMDGDDAVTVTKIEKAEKEAA